MISQRVKDALAFDDALAQIKQVNMMNSRSPEPSKRSCYLRGAIDENMRVRGIAEALCAVVEAAEKIDCQCDARWSGRDEAEYCARGCPDCSCEHHKALRELEAALKGVGV